MNQRIQIATKFKTKALVHIKSLKKEINKLQKQQKDLNKKINKQNDDIQSIYNNLSKCKSLNDINQIKCIIDQILNANEGNIIMTNQYNNNSNNNNNNNINDISLTHQNRNYYRNNNSKSIKLNNNNKPTYKHNYFNDENTFVYGGPLFIC